MKPSTRIICLAGLLLSLLSSCQQTAGSKSELSLKAAAFNQEDAAIAKQFGYSSDPLIFQFTTDSSVQSLHYTVYTLNQGQWEAQWTGDQSLSGLRGRIAVYTDELPKGYTLIMQCDNVCVKDELRVENPDFSMPEPAVLSTAVVMICVNGFGGKGAMNLGIDFSSGTKITVSSNETLNTNEVRSDFEALGYKPSRVQASGDKVVYVTLNQALEQDQLTSIKETLTAKYGIEPNDNVVTPVVGRELVKNAIALSLLAWVAMLIYITIRFKWDYAVSCIVALVHDVAIVLAIFAIFRMEINIELISVILAIIGYSINNSIVVFDRVRESVAESRKPKLTNEDYKQIVNDSLDKTLVRSVFSSITTLLPIIALLLMGSGAIVTFNFAMFVGLIAGTFSSIFIAPQMWYAIRTHVKPKEKKKKKVKKEKLDELTIPGIND